MVAGETVLALPRSSRDLGQKVEGDFAAKSAVVGLSVVEAEGDSRLLTLLPGRYLTPGIKLALALVKGLDLPQLIPLVGGVLLAQHVPAESPR